MLTKTFYDVMAGDVTLTAQLSTYSGSPAVFVTDPAPSDATLPYIVTAGEVAQTPFDTKTTFGRTAFRDVRCYQEANGSPLVVEAIAARVRVLFHKKAFTITGFTEIMSECSGPVAADEERAYGRIVTVKVTAQEN